MLPGSLGLGWPDGVGLMIGWNTTGQDDFSATEIGIRIMLAG